MHGESVVRYPDWELLASWVAVVEAGSISEAAKRLNVSQAGVSQRMKALESILDTELLDRSTRPALPTSAGQRLFEHATAILQSANQMMEAVRSVTRAKRVVIRLGCVDAFAATIGPVIIRALTGTSRQIRLWSGITPTLDALLDARQLDMAVTTTGMSAAPGVRRQKLFSEPYFVVLPLSAAMGQLPGHCRAGSARVGQTNHFDHLASAQWRTARLPPPGMGGDQVRRGRPPLRRRLFLRIRPRSGA